MSGLRRVPRRIDRHDAGETLVEIVLTVVIIGVAMTALVSALATTATASTTNRSTVDADTVMRNFAEAIKDTALDCVDGAPIVVDYTPPDGFAATATPPNALCPAATTTTRLTLDVDGPSGVHQRMEIVVRTP